MNELISLLPLGGIARFVWDLAWQSTLVGVVTLVSLRFLVKHPAARSWFVVLATGLCLAIPLVSVVVRASGLGLLSSASQVAAVIPSVPAVADLLPESGQSNDTIIDHEADPAEISAEENVAALLTVDSTSDTLATRSDLSLPASTGMPWLWTSVPAIATVGWGILAVAALIRLISGIVGVRRLCREAVDCDDAMILGSCRRAARAVGLRQEPQVAISPQTGCPTVLAWGRPILFIPPLACQKSANQWFSVFSHELAHVQRGDGWSQLVMHVATVLLPWQPLIHLLRQEHRQACEEACDDWALFAGADPIDFASTLTEWIPSEPNLLALDIGSGTRSVRRRIERLLKCSSRPRPELGNGWLVGSGTVATCTLCLLALLQTGTLQTHADDQPVGTDSSATDRAAPHHEETIRAAEAPIRAPRQLVAVLGEGRMRHWNSAEVLGFGPQHKTVFSRGLDELLKVWNLETGKELRELELPPSATGYRWWEWDIEMRRKYHVDVQLSPDGNVLFLAKADGTIELLDAATFKLLRILKLPCQLPKKLAISANGKRLAALQLSTTNGECAAVVIDIATGESLGSIKSKILGAVSGTHSAPWRCLELSPDGSTLAVGRNGNASLWDVASGELLREIDGGWNLRFSPDGSTLVACSPNQQLQLWDVATGQLKCSVRSFATSSQVAFNPAGDLLAIVDGSRVRLCRADSGEQLWMSYKYNPSRHYTRPTVAFHRDGKLLATSSGHAVALFDSATGEEIGGDKTAALTSLAVDPKGGQVATGDSNGQLMTWDIASGQRQKTWRGHEHGISPLAFSPDGLTLASAAFEHVVVWHASSGRLQHTLQPEWKQRGSNPVPTQFAFSPDGAKLYAGYRARELALWDVGTGKREGTLKLEPSLLVNYPFEKTRDNQLIAQSLGEPRGLKIWDLESAKLTRILPRSLPRSGGRPRFAVSSDGRRIATGERGNKISVWDLEVDHHIEMLKGHSPRYLRSLAFSPDGQTLASGAEDGKVQLWNSATGEQLDALRIGPRRGFIDQLAFSIDGRYLISKNGNGTVSIIRVGLELLARE